MVQKETIPTTRSGSAFRPAARRSCREEERLVAAHLPAEVDGEAEERPEEEPRQDADEERGEDDERRRDDGEERVEEALEGEGDLLAEVLSHRRLHQGVAPHRVSISPLAFS